MVIKQIQYYRKQPPNKTKKKQNREKMEDSLNEIEYEKLQNNIMDNSIFTIV